MANTAGPTPTPVLAERADIHKSCKSFEVLLNVLNDYCEAVTAVAQLQKKLAKAIRDTAMVKVTAEIPSNVLSGCATIFEALAETEGKRSKLADKEYDAVSSEIKKWFKKLAKEEKAHDERIASANNRIKQAAQQYEKKSKKGPMEASEEHARYMHLISLLGPEVSQEKYEHTLLMSQRHSSATYCVASTLGRIAEAEWLRSCENIRRFSPTVATMAEWRALCDGGWTGDLPGNLPYDQEDPASGNWSQPSQEQSQAQYQQQMVSHHQSASAHPQPDPREEQQQVTTMYSIPPSEPEPHRLSHPNQPSQASQSSSSQQQQASRNSSPQPPYRTPGGLSKGPPPTSFEPPPKLTGLSTPDMGSVRTLSAFPSPPTHFPIPPMGSPLAEEAPSADTARHEGTARHTSQSSINFPSSGGEEEAAREAGKQVSDSPDQISAPLPEMTRQAAPPSPMSPSGGYDPREFGALSPGGAGNAPPASRDTTPRSPGVVSRPGATSPGVSMAQKVAVAPQLERSDTGMSERSYVAAMRNRYSVVGNTPTSPSSSKPAGGFHRSNNSVTEMASRYEPLPSSNAAVTSNSSSPSTSLQRDRPTSPPVTMAGKRTSVPPLTSPVKPQGRTVSGTSAAASPTMSRGDPQADQRAQELMDRERRLREMEETIRVRERELEVGKAELMDRYHSLPCERQQQQSTATPTLSGSRNPSSTNLNSSHNNVNSMSPPRPDVRTRHTSFQLPGEQLPQGPGSLARPVSYAASSTSARSSSHQTNDHAPSCGCASCSVQQYSQSPSAGQGQTAYDLRPPDKPISLRPEKPKGWIRRLSMDVGNAFSSSSSMTGGGAKGGISSNMYATTGAKGGVFGMDQGGRKNASVTNFGKFGQGMQTPSSPGAGVSEDGRFGAVRRSYDVGNRSATNLNNVGRYGR